MVACSSTCFANNRWKGRNRTYVASSRSKRDGPYHQSNLPMKKSRGSPLANRELLALAITQSKSMKDVLIFLGLRAAGGNYGSLRYWAATYGLALPEVDRTVQTARARAYSLIPDTQVFCEESKYQNRSQIKKRLIRDHSFEPVCLLCGIGEEWNGLPLRLQLDHINGIFNDNRISNLRLVCPNCHSQTNNFAGRNQQRNVAPSA